MEYPLQLTFKLLAVAPQIYVRDSRGSLLLYVKQKAFKLKEAVTVFADEAQSRALYSIAADRIIDWSATYEIKSNDGRTLGSLKRQGMRSMWRSHYDVTSAAGRGFTIREANPWVKVADGLLQQIPVVGIFAGYFFHPAYLVQRGEETVFRVQKQAALWEGRYAVTREAAATREDEELAALAMIMMLLLERTRG